MLCWRSFSEWGGYCVADSFTLKSCQYIGDAQQRQNQCAIPVLTTPPIFDGPLTLILRIGRWPCCCRLCLWKLATHWLCIAVTKSVCNYRTYKTTNRWRAVDAHLDALSNQHLLPFILVFIMCWTSSQSFSQIETWFCGKAVRSNILALLCLTRLTFMYLVKRFGGHTLHLVINQYFQATAYHSPIKYLQLILSVKIHKEAGESLTHCVLLVLQSLIPHRFNCIDRHQHIFSLSLGLPRRPIQSGNISHSAHIPLLRAFLNLDAIVLLYIRFTIRQAIFFASIWIFWVTIPVKPILSVRNVFKSAILITFDWMTVHCLDSADIQ